MQLFEIESTTDILIILQCMVIKKGVGTFYNFNH